MMPFTQNRRSDAIKSSATHDIPPNHGVNNTTQYSTRDTLPAAIHPHHHDTISETDEPALLSPSSLQPSSPTASLQTATTKRTTTATNQGNIRKHTPIPFLELSSSAVGDLDETSIDFENVLSVWTGLTKSSSYLRNGKRLENISWRVINRNLVSNKDTLLKIKANDFRTLLQISASKGARQPFLDELGLHSEKQITPKRKTRPLGSRRKSQESNHLLMNLRSSSSSLHKLHTTDQLKKLHPSTSPQLKRPGNSRQVSEISIQHIGKEITEEVSTSEDEDEVDSRHYNHKNVTNNDIVDDNKVSSNSDGISQKIYENDEPSDDDDLEFQQPEPKFVSELFRRDPSNPQVTAEEEAEEDMKKLALINQELQAEKPPILRSSTSTSVVRGFSPSQISVSYVNMSDLNKMNQSDSLNSQPPTENKQQDQHSDVPKVASLFHGSGDTMTMTNSSSRGQEESEKLPSVLSLFGQSDLRQSQAPQSQLTRPETTQQKSLFKNQNPSLPPVSSLFGNKSTPAIAGSVSPTSSPYQDQKAAAANQNLKNQQSHHGKPLNKQTLLSNLGMTTLQNSSKAVKDSNNMFFIESSPSPAESDIVGSIDNITLKDHFPAHLGKHMKESSHLAHQQVSLLDNIDRHHHHHHHHSKPEQQNAHDLFLSQTGITHPNHETHSRATSLFGNNGNGSHQGDSRQEGSPIERSNTSLFQHQNVKNNQLMYSSDSFTDDSDWSSVSEDSDSGSDDAEYHRQRWNDEKLKFSKKDESKKPQIKRSLLSGLFLNEMNPDTKKPGKKPVLLRSSTTSDMNSNSLLTATKQSPALSHQHVIDSKSSLEISSSIGHQRKSSLATPSQTTINALASVTSPTLQARPSFQRKVSTSSVGMNHISSKNSDVSSIYGTSVEKRSAASHLPHPQQQSSLTSFMSKSALNLTSYFVNSRRPSSLNHQSNAPPTAATLLPTALATHMFLPNVHQRARSKLSSVVEGSTTSGSSVENGSAIEADDNESASASLQQRKLSVPTPIPAKSRASSFVSVNGSHLERPNFVNQNNANQMVHHSHNVPVKSKKVIPGEKLSPRLSRKLMLATELSESLRESMIWDRKLNNVALINPQEPAVLGGRNAKNEVEVPDLDNSSISDIEDYDRRELVPKDHALSAVRNQNDADKNPNNTTNNYNANGTPVAKEELTWQDDDELDYHTKGW